MRSAIILLEDQAAKELALKPVLDRRVIDFNVNELKMANVENICLIANDLNLNSADDFTLLILTYMYGYSEKMNYEIEELESTIVINNYKFKNFIIRRKHE